MIENPNIYEYDNIYDEIVESKVKKTFVEAEKVSQNV
jgi:hypothetical protein